MLQQLHFNFFYAALINIGKRLGAQQSKEEKTSRLMAELRSLNLNLPARVWLPIHGDSPHLVVRIPPESAVVLNSKDKAPYLIYVEVLLIDQSQTFRIPNKIACGSQASMRHARSEENLIQRGKTSSVANASNSQNPPEITTISGVPIQGKHCFWEFLLDFFQGPPFLTHYDDLDAVTTDKRKGASAIDELNDAWSQEDDEISNEYLNLKSMLRVVI